ncbi:MAG: ATP-grasp domain-containing protein [Saprospiraceae bacterium]
MINWILQKNLTKPAILKRIKAALNKVDETWEEIEVIPFSKKLPKIKNKAAFNIIYGSTTFMLNAFHEENYKRGVFYNPETFNMKNYVDEWRENVLNSDGCLMELGKINTIKSQPLKEWFIRPNHDGKEFSGRVDTFESLVKWSQKICALNLPDFNAKTMVWIAQPKDIIKEWRLFVVDDKIVSASKYMEQGVLTESEADIPDAMLNFASNRIGEYRLSAIYVMDIAEIADGYKLIECNCFNGTGFYKHDIEKIIGAVNVSIPKK